MSATSTAQFLSRLEQSNLLTTEQLGDARSRLNSDGDSQQVARQLVDDGLLTRWQADMLLAGRSAFFLGRYKLLSQLGQGGMGAVFKAEQTPLGRLVAVKVMARRLIKDAAAMARFRREIEAVSALNHPNVVAAVDADAVGEDHFLVMEYVLGLDLRQVLKSRRRLPVGEACEYVRQAALGLQHAHERGMIHRDIKPSNLLLAFKQNEQIPVVKVVDLGLARFAGESMVQTDLTKTGQIMGTPDYISPEQARESKEADIRSDVYSLGASLFHLLTGEVPFTGGSPIEKITARITEAPPHVRERCADISEELDSIVLRMMAVEPSERHQTPGEVAAALAPFAEISDVAATSDWIANEAIAETVIPQSNSEAEQAGDEAGYSEFLNRLAFAAPADAVVVNGGAGIDGDLAAPTVGKSVLGQITRRKRADRRRLIYWAFGLFALVGMIAGFAVWQRSSQTVLIIDWPAVERDGGTLSVDGRVRQLSRDGALEFSSPEHSRMLRLTRDAYLPIEKTLTLKSGDRFTFRPDWKATPEAAQRLQFAELERDVKAFNKKLAGSGLPDDFSAALALKQEIDDHNRLYGTTAEHAAKVGGLLAALPAPADALRREDIDPYELKMAGQGDPQKAPPELVGILGDSRLKHWNYIQSVAFHPNGKIIATASSDATVTLWDAETGDELHTFRQSLGMRAIDFSPDGKLLAAGGGTQTVTVWDVETKTEHRSLTGHRHSVTSLGFSPRDQLLASGSDDHTIKLWSSVSGDLLKTLTGHFGNVNCIAFSPDGNRLASCSSDRTIKVWDVASGEELRTLSGHTNIVVQVAFSPDGRMLASAGNTGDATVRLWDVETGSEIQQFVARSKFLLFSPDNKSLIGSMNGDGVDLWNVASQTKTKKISSSNLRFGVGCAAFSDDGQTLAVAGYSDASGTLQINQLRLWNSANWQPSTQASTTLAVVDVHPAGDKVAVGSAEGEIDLHDLTDLGKVESIADNESEVLAVRFSPSGRILATGHERSPGRANGEIKLWDTYTRQLTRTFPGGTTGQGVMSLAFGSGQTLGSCLLDQSQRDKGTVNLWNHVTGSNIHTFDGHNQVRMVAFSRDGATFFSGGTSLKALDTVTGTEQFTVDEQHVSSLALSPDGQILALGSHRIQLFDPETGRPLRTPRGEPRTMQGSKDVLSLAFAPDGKTLASATRVGAVKLWDVESGRLLKTLQLGPPGGRVHRVRYTPDGRHLVTANGNGTIYVLRLQEWSAK